MQLVTFICILFFLIFINLYLLSFHNIFKLEFIMKNSNDKALNIILFLLILCQLFSLLQTLIHRTINYCLQYCQL